MLERPGIGHNSRNFAQDQSFTGTEETLITGRLLATDPGDNPLTFTTLTPAKRGQVVIQPDGVFQYRPQAEFHGTDAFEFRVSNP
jgi:hypothetical protein